MKKNIVTILLSALAMFVQLHAGSNLRRPADPEHPMWIVHIDTWNWPDPQKIIDLIPDDIRPYCVMNISLSVSHDDNTGVFNIVRDGYSTAESWVRTCAQNRMWCTVQPSSGGFCHFPDGDMTIYEEFFRKYPNFIGWNYAEQFWGYDDKFSVSVPERLSHFARLMQLADKYGGYLIVSWCGGIWHFDTDPVAMMRRCPELLAECKAHPENLIMCYKYTTSACWYNNESVCLGTFVSGLTDNYGVRFDECGWALADGETYPTAAGLGPVLDQTAMNGATVFDGPELIWRQDFHEVAAVKTADGFTSRRWETFPQFDNIWIDYYRKILDGTIRIPSRKEVINRTRLSLTADVKTGTQQAMYAMPDGIYDGLYKQDGEGQMQQNTLWFKKTGRYPAIPLVQSYYDMEARNIPIRLRSSEFASRWKSEADKVAELNALCPAEYEGDLFAARHENLWVTYYPFRYGTEARARIPLKYNTCDSLCLTYSEYSNGVIREYEDSISIYLNNYRVDTVVPKTDVISIHGCMTRPVLTWRDRGSHEASVVGEQWDDGVYTVSVSHLGAVEIGVKCSGKATDRLADITSALPSPPEQPEEYTGPRQYEAECFDYKNIGECVKNGVGRGIEGYTAQGYVSFGTAAGAVVRDTVTVARAGSYRLTFRYSAPDADVKHVLLYVGRMTTAMMKGAVVFPCTGAADNWSTVVKTVDLSEGDNAIYLRASTVYPAQRLYLDNLVVEADEEETSVTSPSASGKDGSGTVLRREYYNTGGQRLLRPSGGITIVREIMDDGSQHKYIYTDVR